MLPGALLTAFWPPPSLAGGGAGLALYVQTPDQPHSGQYVILFNYSEMFVNLGDPVAFGFY